MSNLLEFIKGELSDIIIYGAGEVGKSARKAAEITKRVKCFVDRKESLWAIKLRNILFPWQKS